MSDITIVSDMTFANTRQIVAKVGDSDARVFVARVPALNITSAAPSLLWHGDVIRIADPVRFGNTFGTDYVRAFLGGE